MREDDGRYPDGTCEMCCSPHHGLWDCPEWVSPIDDLPAWVRHQRVRARFGRAEKASGCRHASRGEKAEAKKRAARARRRAEKLDPENAPTRLRELTRGWAD